MAVAISRIPAHSRRLANMSGYSPLLSSQTSEAILQRHQIRDSVDVGSGMMLLHLRVHTNRSDALLHVMQSFVYSSVYQLFSDCIQFIRVQDASSLTVVWSSDHSMDCI